MNYVYTPTAVERSDPSLAPKKGETWADGNLPLDGYCPELAERLVAISLFGA
jgi:hypothetical protein